MTFLALLSLTLAAFAAARTPRSPTARNPPESCACSETPRVREIRARASEYVELLCSFACLVRRGRVVVVHHANRVRHSDLRSRNRSATCHFVAATRRSNVRAHDARSMSRPAQKSLRFYVRRYLSRLGAVLSSRPAPPTVRSRCGQERWRRHYPVCRFACARFWARTGANGRERTQSDANASSVQGATRQGESKRRNEAQEF